MARESAADRKLRAARIVRRLGRAYPDAHCALRHGSAFELLIATILSAQCTDKKVNEITPALFRRFPTPEALAAAPAAEVEALIRASGFFRQKTKSLIAASGDITEKFGGRVPETLEELTSLRGVARKTANVVLGNAFGVPGLTVDTHMIRVNRRLGLTPEETPEKIERDLMELIPRKEWTLYSHRIITHGRECCDARRPQCELCPIRPECSWPDQPRPKTTPARRTRSARGPHKTAEAGRAGVRRRKGPVRGTAPEAVAP